MSIEWLDVPHTLHELFASVLLEEGLVLDGSDQVVDHQAEDRKNLFLRVVGKVNKIGILNYPLANEKFVKS